MSGSNGKRGEPRVTIGRRDFFKVYASAGVAVLQGCRRRDEEWIESPVRRSTALPGASVWRRSICGQCGAGCEIEVRTVDRLAKKIEGLPDGFVNRGGVCALGHSALQELYHPDRVTAPMRRGESGELEPVSWEEALETAATAVAAAPGAATDRVRFAVRSAAGPLAAVRGDGRGAAAGSLAAGRRGRRAGGRSARLRRGDPSGLRPGASRLRRQHRRALPRRLAERRSLRRRLGRTDRRPARQAGAGRGEAFADGGERRRLAAGAAGQRGLLRARPRRSPAGVGNGR